MNHNERIEKYLNRGKPIDKRAFNSDTPMAYSLMPFIMFANLGAVVLLVFLYGMLAFDEETTLGMAAIIFGSPLAFLLTSGMSISIGNVFLIIVSNWLVKRKQNRANMQGHACLQCGKEFVQTPGVMLCAECTEDVYLAENHKRNHRTLDCLFGMINQMAEERERRFPREEKVKAIQQWLDENPDTDSEYRRIPKERW